MKIPQASITGKFPAGNGARTIIGVGVSAANIDEILFSYGSFATNTASGLRKDAQVAIFEGSGAPNGVVAPALSFPNNKFGIFSGRYTGGAAGPASVYLNGTAALASGAMSWNTTISAQGAQIGRYVGEARRWNGNIGEVIVYNRNLTDPEFQRVSSYLAIKYGITLNQAVATDYLASDGTTKMWTAADNTGYNFRITGIGRDDSTLLNQKQSLSVDTGIVSMAIGDAIAHSNLLNPDTIINNNSYLVFADNGDVTIYNTPISGLQNLTIRMARTWKVDKTNWADMGLTLNLKGGNDKIYLVVSSDAAFDASDAAYQLDPDGNVSVTTDQVPDGAYFTFAKAVNGPGNVNVGVQLWLRADDSISNAATWFDYSGNDNDPNQPTAGNQPVPTAGTATSNYNPAFTFDGVDDYMDFATNGGISGTNPFTVINMGARSTVSTSDAYLAQQGNVNNSFIDYYINTNNYGIGLTGTGAQLSTGVYATPNIPLITATTRAGNIFSLYTNGAADGSGTKTYSFLTTNLRLGNRAVTADAAFAGRINEVATYNRALTSTELQQVHSYLALKYGVTMTGDYLSTDGTTIYWKASGNTGYLNNITGIGRDDNTALYQKQSRTVNLTNNANMIAIGLDSVVATNKANTGTFANDLTYLVWGDNGLNGTQNTEVPTALDPGTCTNITRLSREWKVQNTNNAGPVELQVKLAGQVPTSTVQSDIKLLVDDDGDFGNGGTTIIDPTSYDRTTGAQVATFDGLNLSDGQYFTVVTGLTSKAPGGVITNLYTWYRADKGITVTTGVSLAADQSASGKDVTQATTTAQPLYNTAANLINFNPTFGMNGSSDLLFNSAISHTSATNGEDMFAVILPNTVPGFNSMVGLGTLANTQKATDFYFIANKLSYYTNIGAGSIGIISPTVSNGLVQIANANRSSTGAANLLMNGRTVATGTLSPVFTADYLNIGARRGSAITSLYFNGLIAEVAIYNRQLTQPERQKVESYLAIKYGITLQHDYLDPAGTVLWNATANATYGHNITGIGRDDCNGLHQKQSKSINNTEALVTLGNYLGIAASNATNSNVLDNNTALLLGDDSADRTTWTSAGAPMNRKRLARTWAIQETGNISTVTIQVPANSSSSAGVKFPLEKDGVAYLLVSTSGDFVNDVTEVPMTLNGANWEAAFDFTGNQYFTFATNDACVSSAALLTGYGAVTGAATDKCYIDGWIRFRDPADNSKYIAAIYDPIGLIDRTKITVTANANSAFSDLGKGNPAQATRLMRRMLQVDCSACYDAIANPNPGFTVRMFYSPTEKSDAEGVETNNMQSIMTANGITDPDLFKWFKASDQTVADVLSKLSPPGIAAGGQEWNDGDLATDQVDGIDYVDFAGVNSFSTFGGIWAVDVPTILPVTWLNVQAVPSGNNAITIKWTTATETNNAGFVVERSQDGISYQVVASVAGQSVNTSTPTSYAVIDNNVTPGVTYYYRIRQMDRDGHSSYSKIITAKLNAGNIQYLRIQPNPITATLRWTVTVSRQEHLQASILDITGRALISKELTAQSGENIYTIDMPGYSKGTYLLRIVDEDGWVHTEKFMVE